MLNDMDFKTEKLMPDAWISKSGGILTHKEKMRLIEKRSLGGEFEIAARLAERYDIPMYSDQSSSPQPSVNEA